MMVEFLGIGIFSYLMGSISSLVSSESTLQDILDERVEIIEKWLRKLEHARDKSFSKTLYDSIKEFTRLSYQYDFILVKEKEFYSQLKPRIRHKLVQNLFGVVAKNFYYMFNDNEFEAGAEFTSHFLSNLYSSLHLPNNTIVEQGESFDEFILINEGIVSLQVNNVDPQDPLSDYEFFILPSCSYFGDYQILFKLQSQITYKAGDTRVLVTMCMSKDKLNHLMETYPEARKFYVERAWDRRIEFRRILKRFK